MPAPIPDRIATQLRVNETVYKKIKYIANLENRNVNSQIEYFLKKSVDAYEREHGIIELPVED